MTQQNNLPTKIFWTQVASLIALDLAIIISWMAYHEFQPQLIGLFQYQNHILELLIMQGIILLVTPPIAGILADRLRKKRGVTLPVVNLGINLVAMVFMAVAFTVFMKPTGWILNAFPFMIALWLIAMNIFHSPAISTVELFVPPQKLPQVMALFAVMADLCQAIEPSATDIINSIGAPLTFATGGILVFATGWWFMITVKKFQAHGGGVALPEDSSIAQSNFFKVIPAGLLLGLATMMFVSVFPGWALVKLPMLKELGISANAFISILAGLSAITAILTGNIAEKTGTMKLLLLGALLCTAFSFGAWYGDGYLSLCCFVLFALSVSLIAVCALPIALVNLGTNQKVFGVGLFFSMVELPTSLLTIWIYS